MASRHDPDGAVGALDVLGPQLGSVRPRPLRWGEGDGGDAAQRRFRFPGGKNHQMKTAYVMLEESEEKSLLKRPLNVRVGLPWIFTGTKISITNVCNCVATTVIIENLFVAHWI